MNTYTSSHGNESVGIPITIRATGISEDEALAHTDRVSNVYEATVERTSRGWQAHNNDGDLWVWELEI